MSTRNPSAGSPDPESDYLAPAIGPAAMKAFAHPLRMAMYDYLNDHEAATATMLAKHTGESTGQTSYHLRQLERHGFVAEDPGRGTGRERWWKSLGFRIDGLDLAKDSRYRPALELALAHTAQDRTRTVADWMRRSEDEDPAWVSASVTSRSTATMSRDEVEALKDAVMTLIHEHTTAADERRTAAREAGAAADGSAPGATGQPTSGAARSPDLLEGEAQEAGAAEERRVRVYFDIFPLAEE